METGKIPGEGSGAELHAVGPDGSCFAIMLQNTTMQKANYLVLALLISTLSSCELVGDIFQAGVWTGLILVAIVIVIVIWIIMRVRK